MNHTLVASVFPHELCWIQILHRSWGTQIYTLLNQNKNESQFCNLWVLYDCDYFHTEDLSLYCISSEGAVMLSPAGSLRGGSTPLTSQWLTKATFWSSSTSSVARSSSVTAACWWRASFSEPTATSCSPAVATSACCCPRAPTGCPTLSTQPSMSSAQKPSPSSWISSTLASWTFPVSMWLRWCLQPATCRWTMSSTTARISSNPPWTSVWKMKTVTDASACLRHAASPVEQEKKTQSSNSSKAPAPLAHHLHCGPGTTPDPSLAL